MLEAIQLGQLLTKKQMKEVKGGVSRCCWHTADWKTSECANVSLSDARDAATEYAMATGVRSFYCCKSCIY